jgi:hypothetical protein
MISPDVDSDLRHSEFAEMSPEENEVLNKIRDHIITDPKANPLRTEVLEDELGTYYAQSEENHANANNSSPGELKKRQTQQMQVGGQCKRVQTLFRGT